MIKPNQSLLIRLTGPHFSVFGTYNVSSISRSLRMAQNIQSPQFNNDVQFIWKSVILVQRWYYFDIDHRARKILSGIINIVNENVTHYDHNIIYLINKIISGKASIGSSKSKSLLLKCWLFSLHDWYIGHYLSVKIRCCCRLA